MQLWTCCQEPRIKVSLAGVVVGEGLGANHRGSIASRPILLDQHDLLLLTLSEIGIAQVGMDWVPRCILGLMVSVNLDMSRDIWSSAQSLFRMRAYAFISGDDLRVASRTMVECEI